MAEEPPQGPEPPHQDVLPQAEDVNPKKRQRDVDDDGDDGDDRETSHQAEKNGEVQTPVENHAAATDAASPSSDQPKISKNQLRKQKRQKIREERKVERKLQRKETRHVKTERRRLEREERAEELAQSLGISKDEALRKIRAQEAAEAKAAKPQSKGPVPVAFIIDCDFEKYMRENELVSLAGQVTRSYSMNRNGIYQAHMVISSWGGKLKERFEKVLGCTHQQWKGVSFIEGDFVEAGKEAWNIMTGPRGGKICPTLAGKEELGEQEKDGKPVEKGQVEAEAQESAEEKTVKGNPAVAEFSTDSVVYLSADSPNILDRLEPNTSYVIGGLVDRNREKRLCQQRAEEKGIRTAKLPIGEYLQMASRQVLATNHVVEIMSKWLETGDWAEAFMAVIPKRKGGHLKGEEGDEKAEEGEDGNGNGDGANGHDEEGQAEAGQSMETQEDVSMATEA